MDETGRVELERVQELRSQVEKLGLLSKHRRTAMTFSEWLESMETLQQVAYGAYYDEFHPEEKADSIRMNFMACVKELSEMTDEMGWKPWSSPQGWVNREAVIDEAVDAMHFLANLLKHANCTGAELTAAYKRKMLKNLDRQIAGYDVRMEKCRYCHRDLGSLPADEQLARYESVFDGEVFKFCSINHFKKYCALRRKEILSDASQEPTR